jgi:catecholate siderophore receptor
VTYDLGGGFDIGAGLYAKSASYTTNANVTRLPGYVRCDVGGGWTGRTFYTRVNIFNIADTVYYDAGSTSYAYPGAPISGQVTLGATF